MRVTTGLDNLAISLYRDFSEDVYCAGFLNGVQTDAGLQEEFAQWLQDNYGQEADGFKEYELANLPILHEIVVRHFDRLIKREGKT